MRDHFPSDVLSLPHPQSNMILEHAMATRQPLNGSARRSAHRETMAWHAIRREEACDLQCYGLSAVDCAAAIVDALHNPFYVSEILGAYPVA